MGFIVHWSLILELSDVKYGSIAVGRLIVNLKGATIGFYRGNSKNNIPD